MSEYSNQSGENLRTLIVLALSSVVGLLILIQLFRAQPMDVPSMLIIAVCFVIGVITTAMWGKSSS